MQKMLSYVRRAADHYHMIEDGDRIAVGVSGGKDSLTLLIALAELRRFYPKKYEVVAITLEMGYDEMDFSPVAALCERLNVEYIRIPTQIKQIVFDIRKEENPCSLCAKLRRGALHEAALAAGCKKVALGHHFDDVVETYMLSLFYEGRISCFKPVTFLDRKGVTLPRVLCPLVCPAAGTPHCTQSLPGGRQHQARGGQNPAARSGKAVPRGTQQGVRRHAALPARRLGARPHPL